MVEQIGGDGNGGDPFLRSLPESEFFINYPTLVGLNSDTSVKSSIFSTYQDVFFLPIAALKILTIATAMLKVFCLALNKNNDVFYAIIHLT